MEIDDVAIVYNVIDGDTFDSFPLGRIRIADIDAPESDESGYTEAKNYLSDLINGKRVYLDVDDYRTIDPYQRIICVVYIRYNATHLKNVNKELIEQGYANITDYTDNEFDPTSWTLYLSYPLSNLPEKTYKELLSAYLQKISAYNQLDENFQNLNLLYNTLQSQHDDLNFNYEMLQQNYEQLNQTYQEKMEEISRYDELKSNYNNVSNSYNQLNSKYQQKIDDYDELQDNYNILSSDYEFLNNEKNTLETNIENLSTELNTYKTATLILIPSVPILVVVTFFITRKLKH